RRGSSHRRRPGVPVIVTGSLRRGGDPTPRYVAPPGPRSLLPTPRAATTHPVSGVHSGYTRRPEPPMNHASRLLIALCLLPAAAPAAPGADRPRLVVLTDIGGDPDDQQSMIRLMHYANEFDIEALVASAAGTPGELKKDTVRPELIREIVEAYGKVRPNLLLPPPDYPEAKDLLDRAKSPNP